jgi:uncharacterized protein (TIGR02270 family)
MDRVTAMAVIADIIAQHAEEAAFLWLQRQRAVSDPHYDLADLAALDQRLEANLDGLRIAAEPGWRICQDAMTAKEPGEIFTAGVLAFESGIPDRMDALLAAVVQNAGLQRALHSALGWIDFARIAEPLEKLLNAEMVFLKRIGLSVCAIQRHDPGPMLAACISHADPRIRSRALKAAGELGRLDLLPLVLQYLDDQDEKSRFYAAWSSLLLGDPSAVARLREMTDAGSVYSPRACNLAVRRMDEPQALQWLQRLATRQDAVRWAVSGCGALGDPQAVPWLMEIMQVPELARPAGEAFAMITGVDIAYEDLEGEPPAGFEAGPSEDPEDENVEMDPDEDLPWPRVDRIRQWWHDHGPSFKGSERYLAGRPISADHCSKVLAGGFQRQRISAALEMALMHPGRPLFETRARGVLQQSLLGT